VIIAFRRSCGSGGIDEERPVGEINYDFNLLFREEDHATSFFGELEEHQEAAGFELIALINRCCNSDIESHGFEFDISEMKRFRNEVQISCYTGRSSEMPKEIAGPLCAAGASILRMSVFYEDAPDWDRLYFVEGKKAAKRTYDKQFKLCKVEDITDQLQRLLSSKKFAQASKIVDECDLSRIQPEDEYRWGLIQAHKHTDLAIKLLHAGLYDQSDSDYKSPWLPCVAEYGSTVLLREFLDHGVDPYDSGEFGGITTLHQVLSVANERWQDNLQLLLDRCAGNLNPVTEEGSPLWFGFDSLGNIAACVQYQSAGGLVIPPESFYETFSGKALVIEAIKHGDVETAKQHFDSSYHHDALYLGLRYGNFEFVRWLDRQATIDWRDTLDGKIEPCDILDEYLKVVPVFEIPFFFANRPCIDPRLIDYIIDSIPPDVAAYSRLLIYISGMNYLPQSTALLQKLLVLGADINAHAPINNDPAPTCAADHAMLHDCLDNMEFLLQSGINTDAESLPNSDPLSGWLDSLEGDTKRRGKALFKQYDVA
jgi:hypothetical protein